MNEVEKAAEKYSLEPRHCMPGFVPMGHTGQAFKAGVEWAENRVRQRMIEVGFGPLEVLCYIGGPGEGEPIKIRPSESGDENG